VSNSRELEINGLTEVPDNISCVVWSVFYPDSLQSLDVVSVSRLFRFLAHLPKSSIRVPVITINSVVMEMWNWRVNFQGTPMLSVWLFVLLQRPAQLPLPSLISPRVPFCSEPAESLGGTVGSADHTVGAAEKRKGVLNQLKHHNLQDCDCS